ncbi:MAG: sensor histidine kinase [Dongiaceae bacterium]
MNRRDLLPPALHSLSARVLVLTVAFVLVSEILILGPSIGRSYQVILNQRLEAAYLVTLNSNANVMNETALAPVLREQFGIYEIGLHRQGKTLRLKTGADYNGRPQALFDLNNLTLWDYIREAFALLKRTDTRIVRLTGIPLNEFVPLEVVVDESNLQAALSDYANRQVQLSVAVAIITAMLVFAVLQFYMVSPMQRLTLSMLRFRKEPENPKNSLKPSERTDEIGQAEQELAAMQRDLRLSLRQRARLAALGTAVTKINHDLRNILTAAQLVSDRLALLEDPQVKKLAPRLVAQIDRAIALCARTLSYAKEGEVSLNRTDFSLRALTEEIATSLLPEGGPAHIDIQIADDLTVHADREELYRVITNLLRNALEAEAKHVTVTAKSKEDGGIDIRIADDGPGLRATAKERLFQPFTGSTRSGGTGLGLAIARDLMRAHGGDIMLVETSDKGTVFQLDLPREQQPFHS